MEAQGRAKGGRQRDLEATKAGVGDRQEEAAYIRFLGDEKGVVGRGGGRGLIERVKTG